MCARISHCISRLSSDVESENRKMNDRLKRDLEQLISEHGLKYVIAALARFCHSPSHQIYPEKIMATTFRRLKKIYEYLDEASQ